MTSRAVFSEEINKRLKSKAEESSTKSEEEGEIDDRDDSDNEKHNKTSIRKSNAYDNDIYAEDDDDEYGSSTNRRKQINASKQKETEHSKSLQLLVEGRKKKQGERAAQLAFCIRNISLSLSLLVSQTRKARRAWRSPTTVRPATTTLPTRPSKATKRTPSGKSLMCTRRRATTTMKTTTTAVIMRVIVVFVHGNCAERRSARHPCRSSSPDDRTLDSREHDSKRKKCTPITTRDQLKCMILSRFRMEK